MSTSRIRLVVVPCIFMIGWLEPVLAQDKESVAPPNAVQQFVSLLESEHMLQPVLDDDVSERLFQRTLDAFDPQHIYFTRGDVEALSAEKTQLDDLLRAGDDTFVRLVHETFLSRFAEAKSWIAARLDREFDFERAEFIEADRSETDYPRFAAERRDLWRKRSKLLLLQKIAAGSDLPKAREAVRGRFGRMQRRFADMNADELQAIYLNALASSIDPHSAYLSPQQLQDLRIQTRNELEGIGVRLTSRDGFVVVTGVVAGGAAARDGRIQAGDRILSLRQVAEGSEWIDILDGRLDAVVPLLRGAAGTNVQLLVEHEDGLPEQIELTRARLVLEDGRARGEIVERPNRETAQAVRLGVIEVPSFYRSRPVVTKGESGEKQITDGHSTGADVDAILTRFRNEDVDVVIVDLRENGGGLLQEALHLTGLFIDSGPVVQVQGLAEEVRVLDDPRAGTAWDGPLVVLTSVRSASASEIFAGAIIDYGRGLVIGDPATHGKGTVQRVQTLPTLPEENRGAVKLTTAQFFRPGGQSTQFRGVTPHVTLPSTSGGRVPGESLLDHALPFREVAALEFPRYDAVTPAVVSAVVRRAEARQRDLPTFQQLLREIKRAAVERDRNRISLERDRFLATASSAGQEETGRENDYFAEVLRIASDYLRECQR